MGIRRFYTIELWTVNGTIGIKRMYPPRTGIGKRWISQCNETVIISDPRISSNIRLGCQVDPWPAAALW